MSSHILVIDDEESLRFTLRSFLEDEGFMVTTAASCSEAEELLQQSLFDLVFLDIQLGRQSGMDLPQTQVGNLGGDLVWSFPKLMPPDNATN